MNSTGAFICLVDGFLKLHVYAKFIVLLIFLGWKKNYVCVYILEINIHGLGLCVSLHVQYTVHVGLESDILLLDLGRFLLCICFLS